MTQLILWSTVIVLLAVSFLKDRAKTKIALVKAAKQLSVLLPLLVALVIFLGIVRSVVDPVLIGRLIGPESGILGVSAALITGSVMMIPGFVAFPLAAGFLEIGAGYPQVAGFIAALMGVGISTAPIEIKYFGLRLTLLRNFYCLLTAVVFVVIVWGLGL